MSTRNREQRAADIRLPGPADRDAWLKLWTDYHAYGPQGGAPPPAEVSAATWANFLDPAMPMQALLAEREGGVVGFAHMVVHPTTSLGGPSGLLLDLFVEPDLHGRGIGRALMEAAFSLTEAAGAVRLVWHVRADNLAALRLYERLGLPSGHIVYRSELRARRAAPAEVKG
ncbi:GNAT family N-acetyltransferase [Bosea sp. (in: a-proteobacteria)]|uniref:GNAT family N-acetyltransferase n=1 Tax=Bosea sp. (in: a-proteobacteria) TaxID=1871050 RepID=UPI002FC96C27